EPLGFIKQPEAICYNAKVPWSPTVMGKLLSPAQIAQYREDGYLAPIRVMSEDAAAELRRALEAVEAGMGGPLRGDLRHKSHLLFPFLADLVRHPRLLD